VFQGVLNRRIGDARASREGNAEDRPSSGEVGLYAHPISPVRGDRQLGPARSMTPGWPRMDGQQRAGSSSHRPEHDAFAATRAPSLIMTLRQHLMLDCPSDPYSTSSMSSSAATPIRLLITPRRPRWTAPPLPHRRAPNTRVAPASLRALFAAIVGSDVSRLPPRDRLPQVCSSSTTPRSPARSPPALRRPTGRGRRILDEMLDLPALDAGPDGWNQPFPLVITGVGRVGIEPTTKRL
jgi:hypothetical protein